MRKVGIGVAGLTIGYLIGAFGGGAAISAMSPNRHDRGLEATMTAAFVSGPIGAVVGLVGALILARKRGN